MTSKEKILEEIKDINYAYNDCSKYATIKFLLDEIEEERKGRKKGKWNFIGNNMHECTNCKRAYTVQQFEAMRNYNRDPLNPKFCPNCGADMREEKDNAKIH